MANVSGSVQLIKRKRGVKWYAKYRLPSGRQRMRLLGPAWTEREGRPPAGHYTRKTARAALDAILTDARRGEIHDPGDNSGKTFGDAVAEWLRYVEEERARSTSTLRDYRIIASNSLLPEFGAETPLEEVTEERIDGYRQRLLTEGKLARRTVQKKLAALHGVLKRATQLRWVRQNAAENVERVQLKRSGEFNVLTIEQIEAVARAAQGGQFKAAIIVAAYTGLRTGELRALRWGDIDFASATVHVRRNLPAGGEERLPKSGKVRSVPLMDDAARELDRLSRREHFVSPADRVFCSETGGVLPEDTLRKALYEALSEASIDRKAFPAGGGFRFHDLRHTYGTLAIQVYPVADVKAYMGHAQLATTELYAHHVPKHNAAGALTEFVNAQKQAGSRDTVAIRSRPAEIGKPAFAGN